MEQIGGPVVDRRRRHQQDARSDREAREGAIAPRNGIAKPMGLVDDEHAGGVAGATGRGNDGSGAIGGAAQGFVRDDPGLETDALEHRAPLEHEHCRDDERAWRTLRVRRCQSDV
jgi:hypothetical protein